MMGSQRFWSLEKAKADQVIFDLTPKLADLRKQLSEPNPADYLDALRSRIADTEDRIAVATDLLNRLKDYGVR